MKIYQIFMVPNPVESRLFISMQPIDMNWQTWGQPNPAVCGLHKESKLKLSLETRHCGDVIIVHCHGRIVYRDEATAFSGFVSEILQGGGNVILDLSGVNSLDSAGIGELAALHSQALEKKANLKYAGANSLVRTLLDLTNLDTVLEVHPSLDSALASFREDRVWADC